MIEFIDDEEFCRWNGELTTPEYLINTLGICFSECFEIDNKLIIIGSDIGNDISVYVDAENINDAILLYLKSVAYKREIGTYDNALDERHGFAKVEETLVIDFHEYVQEEIKSIKLLSEATHINVEKCKELNKELNDYYKQLNLPTYESLNRNL